MNRRTALACLGGLVVSACRPSTTRTIRVAALPRFISGPLYLAEERGYFREAGFTLDIQSLTETTQTIPLLAAGKIDVAFSGATPALFNAVAEQARIRIVAARDVAVPGCTHDVHGRRASFPGGFTDARMLAGKRVAVTAPTSLTAFLLDTLLHSAGLETSDVVLLYMRLSESAPALVAGRLDAVVDLDMGFSSPDVVPGPSVAALVPGLQYSYVTFGTRFLEASVEHGAAFLRAYLHGVRDFRAGVVPRAFDQLVQASGVNAEAIRNACRDRLTDVGEIDAASVQRIGDWAARRGFLGAAPEASRVIDRRFLQAASA